MIAGVGDWEGYAGTVGEVPDRERSVGEAVFDLPGVAVLDPVAAAEY